MPQSHCADYLLEPVPASEGEKEGESEGGKGSDSEAGAEGKSESSVKKTGGLVIFAVDISGSMCTTTEVPALQGIH